MKRKVSFSNIQVTDTGFKGINNEMGCKFSASFPLFLIRQAWEGGCKQVEQHADGFGPGMGTMGGDWSGIRDSSPEAVDAMLEASLNHLFG